MSHNVTVRTIRPHDTAEGMKAPGDQYDRTKEDADQLTAQGVVEPVTVPQPAPKRTARRK